MGNEITPAQEIASLESEMGQRGSPYWTDESRQQRYRDLVSARDGHRATPVAAVDSKAAEKRDLEKMMGDRRSPYWRGPEADKLQARYRDLIEQETGVRPDPAGGEGWRATPAEARRTLDPALVAEWGDRFDSNLSRAQDVAQQVVGHLDRETAQLFIGGFDGLSAGTQAAMIRELAMPEASGFAEATASDMEIFRLTDGGEQTIAAWGQSARRRVGIAMDRYNRIVGNLSSAGRVEFNYWFEHMTPRERQLSFWVLGN